MVNPQMVMYEEEFNQIQAVVDRLVRDANAKVVFIVDKNGQLIAASGDIDNVDTTSLASLTAGNIAATGGMAKLLKENEFATQFHEGEKANTAGKFFMGSDERADEEGEKAAGACAMGGRAHHRTVAVARPPPRVGATSSQAAGSGCSRPAPNVSRR